MNSLSFVLVILAAVVILVSVGISGYFYANVRNNLVSRATTVADTFRKYFTESYDQFYTQAEAAIATFQEQDKMEQQFVNSSGRILLSTSGLTSGSMASTEDVSKSLSTQTTQVFTGRDPTSDERVMSVTVPLLSSRGDMIGGDGVRHSGARADHHFAARGRAADLDHHRHCDFGVPDLFDAGRCIQQLFYQVDRGPHPQGKHDCQGNCRGPVWRAAAKNL